MNTIIGFSIGTIRTWENSTNRQDLIKHLKGLPISAVELAFSNKNELLSFRLSPENETWLKNLPYVSIHAPFDLVDGSKDKVELIKQLNRIDSIYKQVNAKNVILHPAQLPSSDLLAKYSINASIENMSRKHGFSLKRIGEIMRKHPKIGLCLDVGHAYRFMPNHTKMIVNKFKKRITQVHLHGAFRGKDHLSLRHASKRFLKSLIPIFTLNVPIIIEEDIKIKDVRLLRSEMLFVKKYLLENSITNDTKSRLTLEKNGVML